MSYEHRTLAVDASTLILLAKVDLLPALAERVRIILTREVRDEAVRKPELWDARLIARMIQERRLSIRRVDVKQTRRLMSDFRLDAGEASSLVLAQDVSATLGTDDAMAIQACKVLGVPFVTALHVLIRFREQRLLAEPEVLAKLEKLQRFGRYGTRILEDAVRRIQGDRTT